MKGNFIMDNFPALDEEEILRDFDNAGADAEVLTFHVLRSELETISNALRVAGTTFATKVLDITVPENDKYFEKLSDEQKNALGSIIETALEQGTACLDLYGVIKEGFNIAE